MVEEHASESLSVFWHDIEGGGTQGGSAVQDTAADHCGLISSTQVMALCGIVGVVSFTGCIYFALRWKRGTDD